MAGGQPSAAGRLQEGGINDGRHRRRKRPASSGKTTKSEADRILGKRGRPLLDQIVEHMKQVAGEKGWPLKRIDICHWQDVEERDWELIDLIMVFDGDPSMASKYWWSYLKETGALKNRWSKFLRGKFIEKFGIGFEPS